MPMTELVFPDGSGLITGVPPRKVGDRHIGGFIYTVIGVESHDPPKIAIYDTKVYQTVRLAYVRCQCNGCTVCQGDAGVCDRKARNETPWNGNPLCTECRKHLI